MYKTIFRNSAKVYKNIPTTEVLTLLTHHKGILKSITTSSAEQITFNRLTVEASGAKIKKGRKIFRPYVVYWMFVLGFAQTHILFLSWHKKSMQKNVKARRTKPTRWVCSFAERRKLAFGSDSSTFLTLISHSGCPVSPHRPICLCGVQNGNIEVL